MSKIFAECVARDAINIKVNGKIRQIEELSQIYNPEKKVLVNRVIYRRAHILVNIGLHVLVMVEQAYPGNKIRKLEYNVRE